jgi:hypothetical protein
VKSYSYEFSLVQQQLRLPQLEENELVKKLKKNEKLRNGHHSRIKKMKIKHFLLVTPYNSKLENLTAQYKT